MGCRSTSLILAFGVGVCGNKRFPPRRLSSSCSGFLVVFAPGVFCIRLQIYSMSCFLGCSGHLHVGHVYGVYLNPRCRNSRIPLSYFRHSMDT